MIDQLMAQDVALSEGDKDKIAKKVAKLDKLLTHWDEDTVWIRVALKPSQKNGGVHALLTVGIPGATLVTEEASDRAVQAVGIAVDEMERELRKRKTRNEQKRRGPGVGEALAAEAAAEPDEEDYAPPADPR
jgi:ribosomal subunit interface protein